MRKLGAGRVAGIIHRRQFTYTCKLQQRRGESRRGRGTEEMVGSLLTMGRQRQVYGGGGDRITAFPVAYCYTLGICAPPSLIRKSFKCDLPCTKRDERKRITGRRKVGRPSFPGVPRHSHVKPRRLHANIRVERR